MTKLATPASFKPGQSGNPKGRPPKGHSITETMKAMLNERPEIKQALGQKLLQMALKGDITAMKTIWNYMDGMPMQNVAVEGEVTVVFDSSLKQDTSDNK